MNKENRANWRWKQANRGTGLSKQKWQHESAIKWNALSTECTWTGHELIYGPEKLVVTKKRKV